MKMKSFVMLAVTGILAASCAYMAPALADNMGSSVQSMDPTGSQASSNMSATSATAGTSTSSTNTDQGTPDTATGDDDY